MPDKRIEDEIKFKNLLKNPERLFGWSYAYFFVIILIIGVFYVKHIDTISFNKLQSSFIDSLNVDRDIPQKKGGILPAVDLDNTLEPSQELIDKGKKLFDANCQSCHGSEGKGDGPAGATLNPPPRNFHTTDGWTNGRTFFDMYKTLQEGIIQNGMAAYEYLPPEDRIAIIHYVRTFGDFPEIQKEDLASKLDAAYNLSAGVEVPNQIPVKRAEKIITQEFQSRFASNITEIISNSNSLGARIIREYVYDPEMFVKSIKRDGLRDNVDEFVNTILMAPDDFGLKPGVKSLSTQEWNELHSFVENIH